MVFFSVITIVRNDEAGLKRTHDSVLSQTFSDYEWIVIDGASSDGTTEFLRTVKDSRLTAISEPDNGIYDAMNKGLNLAKGHYIVFMNAGDTFADNNTVLNVYNVLKNFGYGLLYGDSLEKFDGATLSYKKSRGHSWVLYGMFASHQSIYYSRKLIDSQRYNTAFKVAGDYDFTARLIKLTSSIRYFNMPLSIFDLNGLSLNSRSLGRQENWQVQRNALGMSFMSCLIVRLCYLSSSFLSQHLPLIYKLLRFKQYEG